MRASSRNLWRRDSADSYAYLVRSMPLAGRAQANTRFLMRIVDLLLTARRAWKYRREILKSAGASPSECACSSSASVVRNRSNPIYVSLPRCSLHVVCEEVEYSPYAIQVVAAQSTPPSYYPTRSSVLSQTSSPISGRLVNSIVVEISTEKTSATTGSLPPSTPPPSFRKTTKRMWKPRSRGLMLTDRLVEISSHCLRAPSSAS